MAEWWKNDPIEGQGGGQFWKQDELVSHPAFDESKVPDSERSHPSDGGILDKIGAYAASALEGLPIVGPSFRNVTEDLAALAVKPFSDQSLSDIRSGMDRRNSQNIAEHPIASTAGGITGAVGGTIPMVMAAPAAFGAGSAPLWMRSIASGLTGTGLGGADAAVRSGGDANSALNGAAWGAGFGLVAPGVGSALGAGTRALANRFAPQAGSAAERMFARAATDDNVTDLGPRLSKLGPDAMPMDLGPNLQRQAGALAATPGEAQNIVRSAITDRQAQAGPRVTHALNRVLGKPVDTFDVTHNWVKLRAANAKPAYEKAYDAGEKAIWSPELERLSSSPSVQRAMRGAVNAWRDRAIADGFGAMNPSALVDRGGQLSFLKGKLPVFPNLQFWDYTKRILDDQVRMAYKAGQNQKGEALSNLTRMLRTDLDKMVPEYNAARQAYAGPSALIDAIEEGKQVFSKDVTPGELRHMLSEMTGGEREAFIQGGRAKLAAIMGTARNDALKARQLFDQGFNKEKLATLVGPDQAEQMLKSLDAETAFTRSRDVVTGNSETQARNAASQEISPTKQPGLLRSALNMRFGDAAADLGDKAVGGIMDASAQARNAELARLLTSNDPAAVGRKIQMVQAAQRRGDISAQQAKQITQSIIIGSSQRRRPLEITVSPGRF